MSALPAGVTRSRGDLRLTEIKTHESETLLLAPPNFPNLHLHLQPDDGGHRIPLDHDSRCSRLRGLAETVLNHLIGSDLAQVEILRIVSIILPSARRSLSQDFVTPTPEDFKEFLLQNTPAIVLKSLVSARGPDSLSWGQVLKGPEEDATHNEIFILRELAETIDSLPPSDVSVEQVCVQQAYQQLLVSIAIIHETVHAFTKHVFTPAFITPDLSRLVSDGDGHGESGATFEQEYLHINLQAVWTRVNFKRPRRMWYIENLVSKIKGQTSTPVILDLLFIKTLQSSFLRSEAFVPKTGALQQYSHNPDQCVRYRLGDEAPVSDDDDAEDIVTVDEKDFIMSVTCAPRNVGLGIFTTAPEYE